MPREVSPNPLNLKDQTKLALVRVLTRDVGSLLLSLCLFIGGIFLLALRIPGWSLFLGLPAVQIGIIFAIFSFDRIAQNEAGPNSLHVIRCSICQKPVLVPFWQEEKICKGCQKKVAERS